MEEEFKNHKPKIAINLIIIIFAMASFSYGFLLLDRDDLALLFFIRLVEVTSLIILVAYNVTCFIWYKLIITYTFNTWKYITIVFFIIAGLFITDTLNLYLDMPNIITAKYSCTSGTPQNVHTVYTKTSSYMVFSINGIEFSGGPGFLKADTSGIVEGTYKKYKVKYLKFSKLIVEIEEEQGFNP